MKRVTSRLRRFLDFTSCNLFRKPKAPAVMRRFLTLEQLETRELLSIALPPPASALAQHPQDNPALPAAFDVFNPPVANITPASGAPQLGTLTPQAQADNSLAATGYQFTTLTGASANQDTVFQVFGQTTGANGTLANASIQEVHDDRAVVTIPASLPNNSMYLVWAENAVGASVPFAVNKATAWWIGPNSASPGSTVSVYGENLSSGGSSPQSWIYLQPATGQGQWITPTAVNPYKVDFVVPASLAAGSYQIWVHNGHGGQYGWSSPVTLTVSAPYNYGHLVVKLSDFGGLPNTGADAVPAFLAALKAIGNNGPATIQLQAGTYYISDTLNLTAGFGAGVYLQGAGKNVTFIKALPGFNDEFFINAGPTSALSDFTANTTGANLTVATALTPCPSMVNLAVISRGYNDVNGTHANDVLIKNCDFTGKGIFLGASTQVFITGCNFYATDSATSVISIWSGSGISVTNCTAQDFNLNSPNLADHGLGRFYWANSLWGTQSNVYIANNTTIQFAVPTSYADQNSGEQILWEGTVGAQSTMVTSATANTVTLASLSGDYTAYEAIVTAGKGTGEHLPVLSTNFASGGTTLTLGGTWAVIPDATSRINIQTIVKQVVVYQNNLQGNNNSNSAAAGVETFQGALDFVADGNTMRDLNYGINEFSWGDGNGAQLAYSNLYQNNTMINCDMGIRSYDYGASSGESATHLSIIFRNNVMSGIRTAGLYVLGGYGTNASSTTDLEAFEDNQVTDAPNGIYIEKAAAAPLYVTLYKNVINRGAAPVGSQPVSSQPGWVLAMRSNMYQNYLTSQGASGALTSLQPTFTWNALPGATHYSVWVADLTTGQSPYMQNANITGTSWTLAAPLPAGHSFRWWVQALDNYGAITPWSSSQDFLLTSLSAPTLSLPLGSAPFITAASLQPALTWSAVTGADSYDVWVNDFTTGQSQVLRQTTTSTTLTPTTPLMLGHQYQWWVRALNSGGNSSSWSAGGTFSVTLAPPVLVAPTGSLPNPQPTFTWNPVAGATYYDVWVDDTTTGISQVLRTPISGSQIVTTTSWAAPVALRPGDTYTWWVRALTSSGVTSYWAPAASFTVAKLATPVILSPTSSASNVGLTFTWSPVSAADFYDIWVDDLTSGTSQVLRNPHVNSNSLTVTTLQSGDTYRWWVRAFSNNGNYSVWSTSADFTVS